MNAALIAASKTPTIKMPSIAYHALTPILIVLGAALLGVLGEAVVPRRERFNAQLVVTISGIVGGLIAVGTLHNTHLTTPSPVGPNEQFFGALSVDQVGLFLQGTILALALMATLLISERSIDIGSPIVANAAVVVGSPDDKRLANSDRVQTEVFPMLLFAVSGMLIFPIANNLLLMFVALEVLSLPLYLMAGLARRRRLLSQEASLKYFLLGAFASAFFLYGLALLYGYANSVDLPTIFNAQRSSGKSDVLLYVGLSLVLVGLFFKASIAPFHSWTPDVYQGSPTPVTAFMASCTKVAAFGALLRVLVIGFSGSSWDWRPIIWAVAIASMVVGAVLGVTQTDIKRVLAYSSIAHAGFILVWPRRSHLRQGSEPGHGVMFLRAHLRLHHARQPSACSCWFVTAMVRRRTCREWSGLARKSPLVATVMTILLLSMAGIHADVRVHREVLRV